MSPLETAINREDWKLARRLIKADLRKQPDSHWLITRLGLTYYEEHDYKRALTLEQKAYKLAPLCPLVMWDLAGTFDMLGRYHESIAIYRRIVRRNVNSLAFGDCGEGLKWARSLTADCWYRLAGCTKKLGRITEAIRCYEKYLELRKEGCRSIYPISTVRKELRECVLKTQHKELNRRLKDYRLNPDKGAPWQTVKSRILKAKNIRGVIHAGR